MAAGADPTVVVPITVLVWPQITDTVFDSSFATYRLVFEGLKAMASGSLPTLIVETTLLVGLITETVLEPALVT